MNDELLFYKVLSSPAKGFDYSTIFNAIGKNNFLILYDLERKETFFVLDKGTLNKKGRLITTGMPGMHLLEAIKPIAEPQDISIFSVYRHSIDREKGLFYDVFDIAGNTGFLAVSFSYANNKELAEAKGQLEKILSSKNIKETDMVFKNQFGRASSTAQRDVYHGSEERLILSRLLESINIAILSNGVAYNIHLLAPRNSKGLMRYIDEHFLILGEHELNRATLNSAAGFASLRDSIPFGADYASEFVRFPGFHRLSRLVATSLPYGQKGIEVGRFLKDGTNETEIKVDIDPSSLNLGFIITGLPGSGKTMEAMSIIENIKNHTKNKPSIFIITPTDEWKDFALLHNMFYIRSNDGRTPINFFRCPPGIETERFYGDLAMILSSAAGAGPYQNPMEKCMLNAFRHIYATDKNPDPVLVYEEIERSIIKYHGKKRGGSIKYTKHGENIKSSLENLRVLLNAPEYCIKNGIKIEDLTDKGAVFDISRASLGVRSHLYALILNQIYALTSRFDTKGDGELRLLICLEEAQLIFGSDSPAVRDIRQRIQDFRKQGIGLMLITHNITDIEIGIRRLCQLKMHLKQAPDLAQIAAKELIFGSAEVDDVALKMKLLGSGVAAFGRVIKIGKEKEQEETIFIKTNQYEMPSDVNSPNPMEEYGNKLKLETAKVIKCRFHLKLGENLEVNSASLREPHYISVIYLGEEIESIPLNEIGSRNVALLKGKHHTVRILNKKESTVREFDVDASEDIYLDIRESV
jgi:hypothetical protein